MSRAVIERYYGCAVCGGHGPQPTHYPGCYLLLESIAFAWAAMTAPEAAGQRQAGEAALTGREVIVLVGACRAVLLGRSGDRHDFTITLRSALRKLERMADVDPSEEGRDV